jgi:hypothetical protein
MKTDDSDSSLEYENFGDCVNQATIVSEEGEHEARYTSVSFFDTEAEAEQVLHRLNEFVYSYKTRYISRFRVGKEFSCRSHNGCRLRNIASVKLLGVACQPRTVCTYGASLLFMATRLSTKSRNWPTLFDERTRWARSERQQEDCNSY